MVLWFEAIGALLVGLGGVAIGNRCARLRDWKWLLGYFVPLGIIGIIAISNHFPAVGLTWPVRWLTFGRGKFALIGFVSAVVLATPAFRLPRKRDRKAVLALITSIVLGVAVWPFAAAALVQPQLKSLQTRVDQDAVCLQSTHYTCGPAAAVTALRKLGLPAEEGELALLAFTSPAIGTAPDILAQTLQKRYCKDGLTARLSSFKRIEELKGAEPTIVVTKLSFLIDHYVTVLEVTEDKVIIGDPLTGLKELSLGEFEKLWRRIGIVLGRNSIQAQ